MYTTLYKKLQEKTGFTLIEILLVVGVVGVITSITLVAINPARQFAQTRNVTRANDTRKLHTALIKHAFDNRGAFPAGVSTTLQMIGAAASGCNTRCGTGNTINFIDDTQNKFNLGTYSDTVWDNSGPYGTGVQLTSNGRNALRGGYTSTIKDSTTSTIWSTISWVPKAPYEKEFPDNGISETTYPSGNANMSGNVALYHLNEASGKIMDSSGNNRNSIAQQGVAYRAAGKLKSSLSLSTTTQVKIYPSADTFLDQSAPSNNSGSGTIIQEYPWSVSNNKRGLIKFDLSAIPNGAVINFAQLYMREYTTFGITRTVGMYKMTKNWTEAGATWNRSETGINWTTPGGDFNPTTNATALIYWDGILGWDIWNVSQDVQSFVNGTATNNGWLIKDTSEDASQNYWFFHSKEENDPADDFRPYLLVTYFVESSYVDIGTGIFSSVPSEATVSAWLKTFATPTEGKVAFYNGYGGELQIGAEANTGKFYLSVDYDTPNQQWLGAKSFVGYPAGVWHHVAGVYKAGQWIKVYVDGIEQETLNLPPGGNLFNPQTYHPATIGAYTRYDAVRLNKWNGNIDELAVFTRALSSAEIMDHYLRGAVKIKYQLRSCSMPDCSDGGIFIGPNGVETFYSEVNNATPNKPSFSIFNIANNRYFQYQTSLETDSPTVTPTFPSVTISASGTEYTDDICTDLSSVLIPNYLVSIPFDPQVGTSTKTFYAVKKISSAQITVRACNAELNESIHMSE